MWFPTVEEIQDAVANMFGRNMRIRDASAVTKLTTGKTIGQLAVDAQSKARANADKKEAKFDQAVVNLKAAKVQKKTTRRDFGRAKVDVNKVSRALKATNQD